MGNLTDYENGIIWKEAQDQMDIDASTIKVFAAYLSNIAANVQ